MSVKAIVISGDGLNCENETANAFKLAGAQADIHHINELLKKPELLHDYQILAIPGGFSFGDEISSGQILALKIKHGLKKDFEKFIMDKKLVIGICNGFQTLAKLGLLPYPLKDRLMTLYQNKNAHFIDQWSSMKVEEGQCIWTKNLPESISFPVRHGEGRVVFKGDAKDQKEIYQRLKEKGQIALTYHKDINGSYEQIAGICDESGRIFGLMPHPEAAVNSIVNPSGKKKLGQGTGLYIFKNAVEYVQNNF
jgi:phosphoribosylformylglycinamidine synthase I